MSVQITPRGENEVELEFALGKSVVEVSYEEDATTVDVGRVELVVSKTSLAVRVDGQVWASRGI